VGGKKDEGKFSLFLSPSCPLSGLLIQYFAFTNKNTFQGEGKLKGVKKTRDYFIVTLLPCQDRWTSYSTGGGVSRKLPQVPRNLKPLMIAIYIFKGFNISVESPSPS
jgi:hypothetical protein